MNNLKFILAILIIAIISCKHDPKPEPNPYDKMIHNPLSANRALDTTQIPILHFEESYFDFGIVKQGDTVIHDYVFSNTGNTTLFITNVSSSCGCAVPILEKKILEPGDTSVLKVIFTTENKETFQEKEITLFGNTFPSETKIKLTGIINKN